MAAKETFCTGGAKRNFRATRTSYLRAAKPLFMSDDVRNAGLKGWLFAGFFFLVLLVGALCVYIYNANFSGLVE